MLRSIALLTAILTATSGFPLQAAGRTPASSVSWRDLPAMVQGKKIAVVLPDGAHLKGTVLAVESEKLILDVQHTSDKQHYPKGRVEIPRASVRTFSMTVDRVFWKVTGAAIGLGIGLAIAVPVNAYAHNEGDGAPGAIAAIIAVPTALGFLAGRSADRKTVTVTVID